MAHEPRHPVRGEPDIDPNANVRMPRGGATPEAAEADGPVGAGAGPGRDRQAAILEAPAFPVDILPVYLVKTLPGLFGRVAADIPAPAAPVDYPANIDGPPFIMSGGEP